MNHRLNTALKTNTELCFAKLVLRQSKYLAFATSLALISACQSSDNNDSGVVDSISLTNPLENSAYIDEKIESLLSDYQIPGMAITVVSNTAEIKSWTKGYGVSSQETQAAVDENTSFWLGSVSKHVMGLSIMIARDQGLLDLDEDVRSLVESSAGFSIANPAATPITFRHLMSHSSGIVDSDAYICAYFVNSPDGEQNFLLNLIEEEEICPEDGPTTLSGYLTEYLDESGMYYDEDDNFISVVPGTEYEYSNIGAALAGYSLELKTGQTLAQFAQDALFTPLSMNDTSWDSALLNANNIATPYSYDDELFELPNYELATWPDGGLRASANDIAKLLTTLMNNGTVNGEGQALINPTSLDEMHTLTSDDYGLFTEVVSDFEYNGESHNLIGHTGSDPGAFSFMFFDEQKNTGIAIVSNGDDEGVDEEQLSTELVALVQTLFEAGELMAK